MVQYRKNSHSCSLYQFHRSSKPSQHPVTTILKPRLSHKQTISKYTLDMGKPQLLLLSSLRNFITTQTRIITILMPSPNFKQTANKHTQALLSPQLRNTNINFSLKVPINRIQLFSPRI